MQKLCFIDSVSAALLGIMIIGLAFLASKLGGLTQAGYTVVSVMSGPLFGVYLLGMAIPFCNRIGAISGLISGWVSFFFYCEWFIQHFKNI